MQTSTALLILLPPARQSSSPPPTPARAERSCDTICNVVELTVQSWFGLPFCVRRHRKCAHQHKLESRHCNNLRRDTEAVNCIKIVRGVCASVYFFWYFPFLVCFRTGACRDLHRFLVRYRYFKAFPAHDGGDCVVAVECPGAVCIARGLPPWRWKGLAAVGSSNTCTVFKGTPRNLPAPALLVRQIVLHVALLFRDI